VQLGKRSFTTIRVERISRVCEEGIDRNTNEKRGEGSKGKGGKGDQHEKMGNTKKNKEEDDEIKISSDATPRKRENNKEKKRRRGT